jgi:Cupin
MRHFNIANTPWQDISADGTRYTLLEGTKDKAEGGFSYLLQLPAGAWDLPHWHTSPARLLVLRGELRLGLGDHFNPEQAERFSVGSVLMVPAGEVHFDGCVEETLMFGVAQGPWATHYVT